MSPLVELLSQTRRPGFPADYLLARLARRQADRLESCPAGTGQEARRELDRELDWFHGQLEPELRRQLAPVLLYFEMPALLAALRFSESMDQGATRSSLASSRLNRKLRELLNRDLPFPEKLRELGKRLAPFDPSLAHLDRIRRERGRQGLEQALADGLLAAGRREQPAGPIRETLDRLAEHRKLLRLAKAKDRQSGPNPPGTTGRLTPRLRLLVRRHQELLTDPVGFDHLMLNDLTRDWRRRSRTGGRLEKLLDYLWTCQLVARDCGVRQLTELLGEERVAAAVIL